MGTAILEYLLNMNIEFRNARGPTGFGWKYPNEGVFIEKTLPDIVSEFSINGINYACLAASLHVFYGIFVDYSWDYARKHSFLPIGKAEMKELYNVLSGKGAGVF